MEHSPDYLLVLQALSKAKKEVPPIIKNQYNSFYKSNYADLKVYLDALEEAVNNNGLFILQTINTLKKDAVQVNTYVEKKGETIPIAVMTKECTLKTTVFHLESGQWLSFECPLPNPKGDSQGLGSAISYMRRYSLQTFWGLASVDDDGSASSNLNDSDDKSKKQHVAIKRPAPEIIETPAIDIFKNKHKDKLRYLVQVSNAHGIALDKVWELCMGNEEDFLQKYSEWLGNF